LAMQAPDGQYLVMRDLKPPVAPAAEDVKQIQLIWWIDDRPESVRDLAQALGLREVPRYFIAFFPESFEQKLVQLEKKYKGKQEHQIRETRFRIVYNGK